MRISFTDEQFTDLMEVLDWLTDPCTDMDVELLTKVTKHLKRAESYSNVGYTKIRYIQRAKDKEIQEIRREAIDGLLLALRKK